MFDKLHLLSQDVPDGGQGVTAGQAAASEGQVGVTAGKAAAAAAIVGKPVAVNLAMVAVIGLAVAVGGVVGGVVVYRATRPPAAPEPPSWSAPIAQEPRIPTQTDPRLDRPAPPSVASPATVAVSSENTINTYLGQMLSDASDQVRLVAVQALSTSRDPQAVTALVIALTKDVEPTIRREAALALGKLLDEKTAEDLRKLGLQALATAAERDPDLDVCVAARSALRSLARFLQKQTRPRAPAR